MRKLNLFDWIFLSIVIVGAINWGLVGLINFDIIATIFGKMTWISRVIYGLVGLAGIYVIFLTEMFTKKQL
jgi:uncharacterized protein